jgi:hypothetical protein
MNVIRIGESLFEERVAVTLLLADLGAWGFAAFTTLNYYL